MKISIINQSDTNGGAARAAYRIHRALYGYGLNSRMLVNEFKSGDWTVEGPNTRQFNVLSKIRAPLGRLLMHVFSHQNSLFQSPALLPSHWAKYLNNSDADVVHLHWINFDMMSIKDISKIKKPLIWTLHDMWAFCGAEHLSDNFRWREGYTNRNRPAIESGFDLNKWVWKRKRRAWTQPMQIVTPSHWLADCVRQSKLMRDWPVTVIPNAIDTNIWRPIKKSLARNILGLPDSVPLLLFGTYSTNSAPHKGYDLFKKAMKTLSIKSKSFQLVVFGQCEPRVPEDTEFPIHYVGHLHDDISLLLLYSAVDVLVVPSRIEAFGQTASESMACGTPVVAFGATGLLDVVAHKETGYLAKAFDVEDLAHGIQWVLEDSERYDMLSDRARKDVVARFSYPTVAEEYLKIYKSVVAAQLK